MTINLENLVLEVTRRCNFQCDHCLRGDAEDVDMRRSLLYRIFGDNDIKDDNRLSIYEICFTGGEPALKVPLIRKCGELITDPEYTKKIDIGGIFAVTNGAVNRYEFLSVFHEIRYRADLKNDEFRCAVEVSVDTFHQAHSEYKGLSVADKNAFSFVSKRGPNPNSKNDTDYWKDMIYEGRMTEWEKEPTMRLFEDVDSVHIEINNNYADFGCVYVNVYGQVFFGCNFSYDTQRRFVAEPSDYYIGQLKTADTDGYETLYALLLDRAKKEVQDESLREA